MLLYSINIIYISGILAGTGVITTRRPVTCLAVRCTVASPPTVPSSRVCVRGERGARGSIAAVCRQYRYSNSDVKLCVMHRRPPNYLDYVITNRSLPVCVIVVAVLLCFDVTSSSRGNSIATDNAYSNRLVLNQRFY